MDNRKVEVDKGETVSVFAGVPQGLILGPTLWNITYNGVLDLDWPVGVKAVGFADDLALVARADTSAELKRRMERSLALVDHWVQQRGLELAPQKTEAVMIRGNRKKNEETFRIRDTVIRPQKAIKYLGVWVDDQGTFSRHVRESVKKANERTATLGRLMPRIGGPSFYKRIIMVEVVHSTILYAAPIERCRPQPSRWSRVPCRSTC